LNFVKVNQRIAGRGIGRGYKLIIDVHSHLGVDVENIPVEMAKYRSAVTREEDLDTIFYKNALSIFKLRR
jgi:hypothetical protein